LNPNKDQICAACGGPKPDRQSKAEGKNNSAALKAIHAKMEAGKNLDAEEVKILERGLAPKAAIQAQINAITAKGNLSDANVEKIAVLLGQLGGRRTRRRRRRRHT
jgi:hypothetical protein